MKIKKMTQIALFSLLAGFAAYGMEKPEKGFLDNIKSEEEMMAWLVSGDIPLEYQVKNEHDAIEEAIQEGWRLRSYDRVAFDKTAAEKITQILQHASRDKEGKLLVIKKFGTDLLKTALTFGRTKVAQLLIENGVDMYGSYTSKKNFFEGAAAKTANKELVQYLLESGYNVHHKGYEGKTALEFVLKHAPYVDIIELLLKYGANVEELKRSCSLVHVFKYNSSDWFGSEEDRIRELNHLIDTLKFLYQHGVDINKRNKDGETALRWAILHGWPEIVVLLSKYPELNVIQASDLEYAQKWAKNVPRGPERHRYTGDPAEREKKYERFLEEGGDLAAWKRYMADEKWQKIEFDEMPRYQKTVDILTKLVEEAEKIQNIYPHYKKSLFKPLDEKYDNKDAHSNSEKIEALSSALMRGEEDQNLSPYISVRAPKMMEFIEHLKEGHQDANKVTKKVKFNNK